MLNELFALLAKPNDTTYVLRSIAKNSAERTYLSTLKWVFGVHKKTSNAAILGDSGMYPLLIKTSKQVFNSPVNLCIKREVIPNKGIPLPRYSDRSPEIPPKFAAPPDVEKCHFRATPIWIVGKFRDF